MPLMSEQINGIGARQFDAGWIGTFTRPDGLAALVTTPAPTEKAAVEAAQRWKSRQEPPSGAFQWAQHPKYPGFFEVWQIQKIGQIPVPLEDA